VLVKGEALDSSVPGRADDFTWPPRGPNVATTEALPVSGAPIYASKPIPKPAQPQVAAAPGAGGARVAGQPVLQGHVRPHGAPPPPPFWRRQPPTYDNPFRGFFGLFGR
jgi:hypothetical protein